LYHGRGEQEIIGKAKEILAQQGIDTDSASVVTIDGQVIEADHIAKTASEASDRALEQIKNILFGGGPDEQWSPDTLDYIAEIVMQAYGTSDPYEGYQDEPMGDEDYRELPDDPYEHGAGGGDPDEGY
jgi:hypothetical protein